tara:strand:+ start:2072 stop:3391 length:1320 start_codon:yes stop_codon:yes gene_type:complete
LKAKFKSKKLYVVAGSVAVFGLLSFSYTTYWQPKRTSLWSSDIARASNQNTRTPAQFSESDLPLIEDYFRYNSFHHFISYKLNLEAYASKNENKAKKALSKTIHNLFKKENQVDTLKAFASPNLTTDFMANFIEELDHEGASKGDYQIDLEFVPRNHPAVLFDRESRAVNLWDLNQSKSLQNAIGEKTPPSVLPQEHEFSLIRKVATTEYPNEGQYYQYQGGVISLQLGLNKLHWDAEDRRSDDAEELSGDLIYRRYFKIVHEDEFSFTLDHPDMIIKNTAMAREHEVIPVFATVDISKEFDGHSLSTPKEQMSIHFGDMLPTQKRKRGFLQRVFGDEKKLAFKTGELRFYGRLGKGEGGVDFELVLHTLVYNMNTKTFNAQDSKLTVTLKNEMLDGYTKASATNDIKRILFGPMSGDLAKSLSLGRFHPSLKTIVGGR